MVDPSLLTIQVTMDADFLILSNTNETVSHIPCAIRLKAPEQSTRVPTHIILLIDVSESMTDDNKLINVKRCASSIVDFLTDSDTLSLITFGESAEIHLKQVPADQLHKETIRSRIQSLEVKGCTNLSAGLGYVPEVCEGSLHKSGLLLLTDGHANRGVSEPEALQSIIGSLHEQLPTLSIHCVGYGHDHNANLLQQIAQTVQGSYNVVNSIEDTAFAFGDTLGGLMSCAFQNVTITVPKDSIVHGPYVTRSNDTDCNIQIGDVYSGTKPLLLMDIPHTAYATRQTPLVIIRGMNLPSFTPFTLAPIPSHVTERQQDVELTHLRYTCTKILHAIKSIRRHDSISVASIRQQITEFTEACNDSFLDGHPITKLLRGEIPTMNTLLNQAEIGFIDQATDVMTTQHITSIALGRGFSSPAVRQPHIGGSMRWGGARMRRMTARSITPEPEEENPQELGETQFAFQNGLQSQIASLMREQSQQPESP